MSELKLKTNAEPTIFNKEMVIGTLIAPVIGTIIGGYIGKSRMKDEMEHGKTVSENPSFWNKDTLIGGLAGNFVAYIGVKVALAAITLAALTPIPALLALAAVSAAAVGSIVVGAYIGGKAGESRLKAEYEEAKKQTIVEHIGRTTSPEIAKAVEYSMEHNKEWGKQVAEDRLLAAAQEQAR